MVLTGSFVLSPVIGLSCHRHLAEASVRLDASVEASEPHDFAVRDGCIRRMRRRVHRIFCPTFSDDRETPLLRAKDARKNASDLPDVTSENICGELARRANQVRWKNSCQAKSIARPPSLRGRRTLKCAEDPTLDDRPEALNRVAATRKLWIASLALAMTTDCSS
jgi:hypothetical protein